MIQLVQMIQKARTALQSPQKPSLEDRILWVQRILEDLKKNSAQWIAFESQCQNLPENYIQEFSFQPALHLISESLREASQEPNSLVRYRPLGLISLLLPLPLGLRLVAERAIPALLAGNAILLKVSSRSQDFADRLKNLIQKAQIPEAYFQVTSLKGADVGELLTQHPSVRGVGFAGRFLTAEKLFKTSQWAQKKWQVSKSTNNSAIFLGESWSDAQLQDLLRACFDGSGQMPWNIKKIFVPESILKDFGQAFTKAAEGVVCPLPSTERVQAVDLQVQKIKEEQGKILCGGKPVEDAKAYPATVILDLSHCSTFQQDEIQGPVVLLAGVKYSHEAAKWANTGYLSNFAIVFGDEEKSRRFAEKLEVSQVLINRSFRGSDSFLGESQQTAFGSQNFHVFGDFYSETQKIDTEAVNRMTI